MSVMPSKEKALGMYRLNSVSLVISFIVVLFNVYLFCVFVLVERG